MIPYVIAGFLLGVLSTYLFFVLQKRKNNLPKITVKAPYRTSQVATGNAGNEPDIDRSVIYLDDQHDMDIERLRADEAM